MTDIVKNVASNARPQINIKRKKIVKVQEGHTGAWKVAYADFVTAMMAFFMLMWLMNATTEKQKTEPRQRAKVDKSLQVLSIFITIVIEYHCQNFLEYLWIYLYLHESMCLGPKRFQKAGADALQSRGGLRILHGCICLIWSKVKDRG
ncbi:MAG: flagellar motor protein MotB, partial [Paracoccaceae bacterium]